MVADGSCTWDEHITPCGLVKSLCCTAETNVTLCVNYIQSNKNNMIGGNGLSTHVFISQRRVGRDYE